MSPFEVVVDRLGDRLGTLSRRAQVLFFACAGQVLLPSYIAWLVREPHEQRRAGVLECALDAARSFATTGVQPADLDGLIAMMERTAPEAEGYTAAQDAWISGDIALRVAGGTFEPKDGVWYVLEPQFQATSERLFGASDVGSEHEEEGEAAALSEPALAAAVAGLERALDYLDDVAEPADSDARTVVEVLAALAV